jgi:hypothetical protein
MIARYSKNLITFENFPTHGIKSRVFRYFWPKSLKEKELPKTVPKRLMTLDHV